MVAVGLALATTIACCDRPPQPGNAGAADDAPVQHRAAETRMTHTLRVGPTRAVQRPSQAALLVHDGDTVLIDPGAYNDCAVWRANNLTIAASGPGVVFAGKTCQSKAIFVIDGNDVLVRGITFTHAAVPDHNGAGIRGQGGNLTVEDSRFLDNEEGILAGALPHATIRVSDSDFHGNGSCAAACAHGIYVGAIGLLIVENSRFDDTHEGHDIKSRALRAIIRHNMISDGPDGHSSYLIDIPNGGDVLLENNLLSKGPHSDNTSTAIAIGEEGQHNPTHTLIIRRNRFSNLLPGPTVFVTNRTTVPVELEGNTLTGSVQPLQGPGSIR
jgi:hypothetical protein